MVYNSWFDEAYEYAKYMGMVLELEKKYSNDQDLGREIRKLIHGDNDGNDVANTKDQS